MKKFVITLTMIIALLTIMCVAVFAVDRYVQQDAEGNGSGSSWVNAFTTIAAAITAAASGDTIHVMGPYVYPERLTVNKSLTFVGVNNPSVIPTSSGTVFDITATSSVSGFIIDSMLCGISISAAAPNTVITNNVIQNCANRGISCLAVTATISNNVIRYNAVSGNVGGGAFIAKTATIVNNLFQGNTALNGGALCFDTNTGEDGLSLVSNNTFVNNSCPAANGKGGAIDTFILNVNIKNNIFAGNVAGASGSALRLWTVNGTGDVAHNTFYDNSIYPPYDPANWGLIGVDGNDSNNPQFVSSNDFRLQAGSACINSGDNNFAYGCNDLVGFPRILATTVDRGCYEGGSVLTDTRTVGDYVELRGKPATGNFGAFFYLEEPNRVKGIKVLGSTSVCAGDIVSVSGQYVTSYNELAIQPLAISSVEGSSENIPAPFGMNNKALGGLNIGLLVRVCGRVISGAPGSTYVINDGSGNTTVIWGGSSHFTDEYVAVTGVSSHGCVRATSMQQISTGGLMSVRPTAAKKKHLASVVSNRQRQIDSLLSWRAFAQEQIDKINRKSPLTASDISWRELMEVWVRQADAKLATLR